MSGWIQWKGTDLCMDFTCPCGAEGHVDAEFAYYVRCSKCDVCYKMPETVVLKRVPSSTTVTAVDVEPDSE